MLALIDRQARRLEDAPVAPGPYLTAFLTIVAARHVLEIFSGRNPIYFPLQFYVHYPLAYAAPLLALVLVLHLTAAVPLVRVARLMLYTWALTLLPPVVDLLLGRGGEAIGYLRPDGAGLGRIFLRFLDPSAEFAGTTPGIRVETAVACLLGAVYVLLRRRQRSRGWRLALAAGFAAAGVYVTALGFFTLPRLFETAARAGAGWHAAALYAQPARLAVSKANPEVVADTLYTLYLVPLCLALGLAAAWRASPALGRSLLRHGATAAAFPAGVVTSLGLLAGHTIRLYLEPGLAAAAPVDRLAAGGLVVAAMLTPAAARLAAAGLAWGASALGAAGLILALCSGFAPGMLLLTALAVEMARRLPPLDLDRRPPAGGLAAAVAALSLLGLGLTWSLGQEALLLTPGRLVAGLMAGSALFSLAPSARRLGAWAPVTLRVAAAAAVAAALRPPLAPAVAGLALTTVAALWSAGGRPRPESMRLAWSAALLLLAAPAVTAPARAHEMARQVGERPRLWVYRGMQAVRAGEFDAAITCYRRALASDPDQAGVQAAVGELLWERRDDVAAAETAFRASLAADPDHTQSRANLGRLLRLEGRAEEALSVLSGDGSRQPDEPILWLEMARCLGDLGRDAEEAAAWRRYLDTSAGHPGHDDARAEARVRLFRLQRSSGPGA